MRCLDGSPSDALQYTALKMGPTLAANYTLWPAAHILNFAFVPPEQRMLFCNVVGLFWTVIVSTIANAAPAAAAASQKQKLAGRQEGAR
jgi:protein Mpv17